MPRFEPHSFPKNNNFLPNENLFRALSTDMVDGNTVLNTAIVLPAPSFNRSLYYPAEDVLRGHKPSMNGIGVLEVKAVQPVALDNVQYSIDVEHDPLFDTKYFIENYAHTELRVYERNLGFNKNRRIKPEHDKLLRDEIADKMVVLKSPIDISGQDF